MLDAVTRDIRLACRGLWRSRAVTGTAVLILSLGIAGTTTMFALVQGVLLRPLPVRDQERLIIAWKQLPGAESARYPFGHTETDAVARSSQLLADVGGVTRNGVGRRAMVDAGEAGYANVAEVTGGFFDVLGVRPLLGRALRPADDTVGAERVVVLARGLWERRFGASRAVLGRMVTLDDQPVRIVGVMPADVDYPAGVEVWQPTASVATDGPFGNAAWSEVNLVGRLRAGATIEQATSEIVALSARLEASAPRGATRGLVPVVRPFADVVVGDVRRPLLALLGAVGLVLLIASANVANLLLMRADAQRGERALRAALGASRSRLIGQALVESLALAAVAGVVGIAISWCSLGALVAWVPGGLPRAASVRIDAAVVAFSIGVVLTAAFLAGLGPALLSMRSDLLTPLRGAGTGCSRAAGTHGRRILVVVQVALAVTIVAAAGLLVRSVLKLEAVDLGLSADRLVLVDLHVPRETVADRAQHAQFLDDLMARLEGTPAIHAATPVNLPPFLGHGWDLPHVAAEGQNAEEAAANPSLNVESIHPGYFGTLGIPILRGRAFTAADRAGAPDVAIVSADFAERTWRGVDPVGRRLQMGGVGSDGPWYVVVGVAGRTRYRELRDWRPTIYLPAAQFQMTATMLVLRTAAPLDLVASLVRSQVKAVNRQVEVMRVTPFADMLARPLARPRFDALLLGVFGLLSLVLCAVGLYAVMAAYVRQRDREIAVRLALGATAARVRRFVLAEAVRLAGLGALLGLAGAVGAGVLLRGLLFDVVPLDVPAIAAAALLLLAAAALATYLPLRRATRLDPMVVLRGD
jgi:putative ABC transport system permease protein